MTAGGRTQARAVLSQSSYYSLDDLRLSFGLGAADRVERLEVLWPSGQKDTIEGVAAGRVVSVREGHGVVPSSR